MTKNFTNLLKGNDREGTQFDFMHFNDKVEYGININFFALTAFSLNISFRVDKQPVRKSKGNFRLRPTEADLQQHL